MVQGDNAPQPSQDKSRAGSEYVNSQESAEVVANGVSETSLDHYSEISQKSNENEELHQGPYESLDQQSVLAMNNRQPPVYENPVQLIDLSTPSFNTDCENAV